MYFKKSIVQTIIEKNQRLSKITKHHLQQNFASSSVVAQDSCSIISASHSNEDIGCIYEDFDTPIFLEDQSLHDSAYVTTESEKSDKSHHTPDSDQTHPQILHHSSSSKSTKDDSGHKLDDASHGTSIHAHGSGSASAHDSSSSHACDTHHSLDEHSGRSHAYPELDAHSLQSDEPISLADAKVLIRIVRDQLKKNKTSSNVGNDGGNSSSYHLSGGDRSAPSEDHSAYRSSSHTSIKHQEHQDDIF